MGMRKISWVLLLTIVIMVTSGCVSQQDFDDLKARNRIQQDRIADLESQLSTSEVMLEQMQNRLESLQAQNDASTGSNAEEIAALEKAIEDKKALIAKMQAQLLKGGAPLPMELNIKLQDFAKGSDMVTFDESAGVLKFKSDLLFAPGSDIVSPAAGKSVKVLSDIINSGAAKDFDIVIAGHTDDVPIKRAATKAKHPTNWHLSAHRAIAVLNLLKTNKVASGRLSIRGFGEFRPLAPNKPKKKGNAANRRVEIFIVPAGT